MHISLCVVWKYVPIQGFESPNELNALHLPYHNLKRSIAKSVLQKNFNSLKWKN